MRLNNRGFSIVELTFVVAIIAVITAMVMSSRRLVSVSEAQSVIVEVHQVQSMIEHFESKYEGLPGDFDEAHAKWGDDCALSEDDCNGDGDGRIEPGSDDDDRESLRFWQHLSLASILDRELTGVGSEARLNENVLSSGLRSSGYLVSYGALSASTETRNEIRLGAFLVGGMLDNSSLVPSFAYFVDKTIDDGSPETGLVFAADGQDVAGDPVEERCVNAGEYNRSQSENAACRMSFPIR